MKRRIATYLIWFAWLALLAGLAYGGDRFYDGEWASGLIGLYLGIMGAMLTGMLGVYLHDQSKPDHWPLIEIALAWLSVPLWFYLFHP